MLLIDGIASKTCAKPCLRAILRYLSVFTFFFTFPFATEFINFYGKVDYSSWRCSGQNCSNITAYNRDVLCSGLINPHDVVWNSSISILSQWNKTCESETLVHQDLYFAGSITGGVVCGFGLHYFGRKVWVQTSGTLGIIVLIIELMFSGYSFFYVCKFFEAVTLIQYFISGFVWLSETFSRKYRPALLVSYTVSSLLGRVVMSVSAIYLKHWIYVHIIFLAILIITVILFTGLAISIPYQLTDTLEVNSNLNQSLPTVSINWKQDNTASSKDTPVQADNKIQNIFGFYVLFCHIGVTSVMFAVAGTFNSFYSRGITSTSYMETYSIYMVVVGVGGLVVSATIKYYRFVLLSLFLLLAALAIASSLSKPAVINAVIAATSQLTTITLLYLSAELFPVVHRGVVLSVGMTLFWTGCLVNCYFVINTDQTADISTTIILVVVGVICGVFAFTLPQTKVGHSSKRRPSCSANSTSNELKEPVGVESRMGLEDSKYTLSNHVLDKMDQICMGNISKCEVHYNYSDEIANEIELVSYSPQDQRKSKTKFNFDRVQTTIVPPDDFVSMVDVHREFPLVVTPKAQPSITHKRFAEYMSNDGKFAVTPEEMPPQNIIKDNWKSRMREMQLVYGSEVVEYFSSSESSHSTETMEIGDITLHEEDISIYSDDSPIHFLPLTLLFSQDLSLVE